MSIQFPLCTCSPCFPTQFSVSAALLRLIIKSVSSVVFSANIYPLFFFKRSFDEITLQVVWGRRISTHFSRDSEVLGRRLESLGVFFVSLNILNCARKRYIIIFSRLCLVTLGSCEKVIFFLENDKIELVNYAVELHNIIKKTTNCIFP